MLTSTYCAHLFLPHRGLNWRFPGNQWSWSYFHVCICHLYIFFCKRPVQLSAPLKNSCAWVLLWTIKCFLSIPGFSFRCLSGVLVEMCYPLAYALGFEWVRGFFFSPRHFCLYLWGTLCECVCMCVKKRSYVAQTCLEFIVYPRVTLNSPPSCSASPVLWLQVRVTTTYSSFIFKNLCWHCM